MSEKELAMQLLEQLPAEKLGYVIAYMQGLTAQEIEDDVFCEKLYQSYLQDKDPEKDIGTPLEVCKKDWGIA